MKRYEGRRAADGCTVTVCEEGAEPRPLNPRFDIRRHSPTGYEWGYGGSGPAQLALALLADALGDDKRVQRHYQDFKFKVVGRLPHDRWELSQEDIMQKVASMEQVRARSPK